MFSCIKTSTPWR